MLNLEISCHGAERKKLHDPGVGPLRWSEHLHGVEGAERSHRGSVDSGEHAPEGKGGRAGTQLRAERECATLFQAAQLRDRPAGAAAGGDGAQRLSRHTFCGYFKRDREGVEHHQLQSAAALQPPGIQSREPVRGDVQFRFRGRAADLGRAPVGRVLAGAGGADAAAYFSDVDAGLLPG